MKPLKMLVIAAAAAAAVAPFVLWELAYADGWSADLDIHSAFTEESDVIAVYTTGGGVYTTGCTPNTWVLQASTEARRARMYATVLTAIASGKKIRLYATSGCNPWGYHIATSVMILN